MKKLLALVLTLALCLSMVAGVASAEAAGKVCISILLNPA